MALLSLLRRLLALVLSTVKGKPLFWKSPAGHPFAVDPRRGLVFPPIAGAEEDPDPKDPDPKDPDPKDPEDDPEKVTPEDDWKEKSRKNESRAKKAEREAKEAQEALKKREEADQTDQEKAVSAAEKKGREEAESKALEERKADRLEVAVTRLASKKIKVGSGDDAKEYRFADTDDALMHIERAISKGEIDAEDIFNKEGKVDTDALQKELADLLSRKAHLRDGGDSSSSGGGDPDTRKGGPASSDLEAMSPEDHAKRKYGDGK